MERYQSFRELKEHETPKNVTKEKLVKNETDVIEFIELLRKSVIVEEKSNEILLTGKKEIND